MQVKLKICDGCTQSKPIWKNHLGKRYCSVCWSKQKPTAPVKRSIVLPKQRTPIKKQSDKRKKEDILYSTMRKVFLDQHPVCQANAVNECLKRSDQIHHKAGRTGSLYLDTTYWLAVCGPCHRRITDFPVEALENGWSVLRLSK